MNAGQRVTRVSVMDFIEKLFGVSPDGGDGSLEVLWLIAGIAAVAGLAFRSGIKARFQKRSNRT
jgi:hypothetical protein